MEEKLKAVSLRELLENLEKERREIASQYASGLITYEEMMFKFKGLETITVFVNQD